MNYLSEVAETVISASEYELPPEEEPELVETVAEEDLDVDFQDLSPLIRSNSQIYISQRKMASKRLRFRSNSCSIAEKFQRDGFALTREVLDDSLPEWFADRRFEEESAMAEDESEETNDDDKSDADIDSENSTDKTAADEQKKQDNGDEEDEKDDDSRDNDETEDDPLDENNMKTTEDDYEVSCAANISN
jgi:hypothetical protein